MQTACANKQHHQQAQFIFRQPLCFQLYSTVQRELKKESNGYSALHKASVTRSTSSIIDIQGNQYDFRISFTPGKPAHCVIGFIIGKNGGKIETGWNNDGAGVCDRVIRLDTGMRAREGKGERSAGKTDNEAILDKGSRHYIWTSAKCKVCK